MSICRGRAASAEQGAVWQGTSLSHGDWQIETNGLSELEECGQSTEAGNKYKATGCLSDLASTVNSKQSQQASGYTWFPGSWVYKLIEHSEALGES